MNYTRINNLTGWLVFLFSLIIYILTLEPTASYWDCGEFIACAYKLQVSHAPGAPVHMLFGRIFSLFAGNDVSRVAFWVNMFSAVTSALTVLFLFWTITHFAYRLVGTDKDLTALNKILIFGSGIIGAMACTFMDTFWFSAVEGEVYAFSSFLTAIVFWAILKWENEYGSPRSFRWIVLIGFIMGFSIGVHLLNLLALPAIVCVIYFKERELSIKRVLIALGVSGLLILILIYIFIPGVVGLGAYTDLLFVNVFKAPVNSGFYVFILLLGILLFLGLRYYRQAKNLIVYRITLITVYMLIGYFSYLLTIMRSEANPTIDMTNPDNPFGLVSYLNREHYGSRPLFHGQYYNAPVKKVKERSSYIPFNGKYIKEPLHSKYEYDSRFTTIFPRMTENEQKHIDAYKKWGRIKGEKIRVTQGGESKVLIKPTFGENLRFFFRYQIGHMYIRYFMWNFSGRQNDVQGFGGILDGNWITGIKFLDSMRLDNQDDLTDIMKETPGRNIYFMLPFLLGLAGFLYQWKKEKKGGLALLLFFFFTGLAIVIYLNEVPVTPRERDYVYVGSFYVFTIWIGLGVFYLFKQIGKFLPGKVAVIASLILAAVIPLLMSMQNWDDHDRSDRFIARDFAENALNSCDTNAILFTYGDNDTYPIWYAQEVENIRPDVKSVLYPYTGLDWYANQLKQPDNGNLPYTFEEKHFINGKRQYFPIVPRLNTSINVTELIRFLQMETPDAKFRFSNGELMNYIPSKRISIPISREVLLEYGMDEEKATSDTSIELELKQGHLYLSQVLLLDLIVQNNWKRPIYFMSPYEIYELGFGEYLKQEGIVYRLMPYKVSNTDKGYRFSLDTEKTTQLLMKEYHWGNIEKPSVYKDWTIRRQISVFGFPYAFLQLANSLVKEMRYSEAVSALNKCQELFNSEILDDYLSLQMINTYMLAQDSESAHGLAEKLSNNLKQKIDFYNSLKSRNKKVLKEEIDRTNAIYQELQKINSAMGQNVVPGMD